VIDCDGKEMTKPFSGELLPDFGTVPKFPNKPFKVYENGRRHKWVHRPGSS
jgi:hypothetical protein